jgi:hypothetical protein
MTKRWQQRLCGVLGMVCLLLVAQEGVAKKMVKFTSQDIMQRHEKRMKECQKACKARCRKAKGRRDACMFDYMGVQKTAAWRKEFERKKASGQKFESDRIFEEKTKKKGVDNSELLHGSYLDCIEEALGAAGG